MPNKETTSTKFDQYLAQIESRERSKRRRYQIVAIVAFVVLAGGAGFWLMGDSPESRALRHFEARDLDYSMVKNLFDSEQAEIVVAHPAIGVDTIYSPEDYLSLRGLLDQLENNAFETSNEMEVDVPPTFAVDIAGSREAGSTLIFSIENFDEDLTYIMDFGNGYRREVSQSMSYSYRSPGNYRLRLIATNEQGSSSIYNKSIRINGTSAPQAQQESVIADNSEEDAPEPQEAPQTTDNLSAVNDLQGLSAMRGRPVSGDAISPETPSLRENVPSIQEAAPERPAVPSSSEPLIATEVAPSFPGGMAELGNFVRSNYRYPRSAQNSNIEGKVYVMFVVNADGSISNPRVIRGIGGGCDEEALRLVSMMPKWNPGKQNGVAVATYQTVPITFKLLR